MEKISLIIPAYNEEKRIVKSLDKICSYMEDNFESYEIIVVDDGSKDNTRQILNNYKRKNVFPVTYEKNRGKGGAIKFGVEMADGDYIIFTDADLPYPIENVGKAIKIFQETNADMVLGSRLQTENGQKYPWYRNVMSYGFSLVVRLILKMNVPDTQCGFKCFKKAPAKKIFSMCTLNGWGFDVEMIFISQKLGCKLERIGVELFHENDESKISVVKSTISMFKEVLKIKENDKNKLYN